MKDRIHRLDLPKRKRLLLGGRSRVCGLLAAGVWIGLIGSGSPAKLHAQAFFPLVQEYAYPNGQRLTEPQGAIAQDRNGFVYIGEEQGVAIYAGERVARVRTPSPVTALLFDTASNRVLVGCEKTFGYLPDTNVLEMSFRHILPVDSQTQAPVTQIFQLPTELAFYTDRGLYSRDPSTYTHKAFVSISPYAFKGAFALGALVYLNTPERGILEYSQAKKRYLDGYPKKLYAGKRITFSERVSPYNTLVGFEDNSVVTVQGAITGSEPLLSSEEGGAYGNLRTLLPLPTGILIVTQRSGCQFARLNTSGGYAVLENLSVLKSITGLPDNSILSARVGPDGQLWLTHPYGFSRVRYDLPLNQYLPLNSRINSMLSFRGQLYAATDDGVFALPENPDSLIFQRVLDVMIRNKATDNGRLPETESTRSIEYRGYEFDRVSTIEAVRCNHLIPYDGRLVVAAANGIYALDGTKKKTRANRSARYLLPSTRVPGRIYAVNEGAVEVYQVREGRWRYQGKLRFENLSGSIMQLAEDNSGVVWAATSRELFYFKQVPEVETLLGRYQRLLSSSNAEVQLTRTGKHLYGLVGEEVYELADSQRTRVTDQFTKQSTGRVYALAGTDLSAWLMMGQHLYRAKRAGVKLQPAQQSTVLAALPPPQHMLYTGSGLWMSTGKQVFKLLQIDPLPASPDWNINLLMESVTLTGKPFFGEFITNRSVRDTQDLSLPYAASYNLAFDFLAPSFYASANDRVDLSYEVYLNGDFLTRETDNHLNFTATGAGSYRLEFVAVSPEGKRSQVVTYAFTVAQPLWFQPWAIALYVLFGVGGWLLTVRVREGRSRREANKLKKARDEALAEANEANAHKQELLTLLNEYQLHAQREGFVATMAHEINTPTGAIKGAAQNLQAGLPEVLQHVPAVLASLPLETRQALAPLLKRAVATRPFLTAREEREAIRAMTDTLAAVEVAEAKAIAQSLVRIGVRQDELPDYAALLAQPSLSPILQRIAEVARLTGNLSSILQSAEKIAQQVKDLQTQLDQAGPISDQLDTVTPLSKPARMALRMLQTERPQADVDYRLELVQDLYVRMPENYLLSVWNNLLKNAHDAMSDKGTLTIRTQHQDGWARLEVEDSGTGIAPEIQEKVFDHLFTTKPTGKGTGIGLEYTKRLVEEAGGRIWFESQPGRTVFYVELPAAGPPT